MPSSSMTIGMPVGRLVVAAQHQRELRVLADLLRLRIVVPRAPAEGAHVPRQLGQLGVGQHSALGQVGHVDTAGAHHIPARQVHAAARVHELPAVGVARAVVQLPHELERVLARRVDVVRQAAVGVPIPLGLVGVLRIADPDGLAPGDGKPAGITLHVPRRLGRKGVVVGQEADVEPTGARHKVAPVRHRGRPRAHRDVCADAQIRERDLQLRHDLRRGKARGNHHVRQRVHVLLDDSGGVLDMVRGVPAAQAVGKPVEEDGHNGQLGLAHVHGAPPRRANTFDKVQRSAVLGVAKGRAVAVRVEREAGGVVQKEGHLEIYGLAAGHQGTLRVHGELSDPRGGAGCCAQQNEGWRPDPHFHDF
eukprot:scaffold31868_cov67-Phaeocystis_antarctica.AAC.5